MTGVKEYEILLEEFEKFIISVNVSGMDALDIGSGTGKFSYRLFHLYGVKSIRGL